MKKILIIEDDRGIAELERDYLEASDFQVARSRWLPDLQGITQGKGTAYTYGISPAGGY